jgi:hypothetical protein
MQVHADGAGHLTQFGQRFPLAPHVKHLQDVIEEGVQRQRGSRSTTAPVQMGHDKLLKLLTTQIRWDRLPVLTSSHPSYIANLDVNRSEREKRQIHSRCGSQTNLTPAKNPQPVVVQLN